MVERNSLVELLLYFGSIVCRRFFEFVFNICLTGYDLFLYVFADHSGAECSERSHVGRVVARRRRVRAQYSVHEAPERVAHLVDLPRELEVVEARPVKMYTRPEGLGWLQNGERGRVVVGRRGS